VRVLGDCIRNDAIDANHGQQQCKCGEAGNCDPIELRPGQRIIQSLLHGLYSEDRNLRVYRLNRVTNYGEAIFGRALDASHECGEKVAWPRGGKEHLPRIAVNGFVLRVSIVHPLDNTDNLPWLAEDLMAESIGRRTEFRGKSLIHDCDAGIALYFRGGELPSCHNASAHRSEVV
jgi:hypothetical protein